jgi:hypothetical protein
MRNIAGGVLVWKASLTQLPIDHVPLHLACTQLPIENGLNGPIDSIGSPKLTNKKI